MGFAPIFAAVAALFLAAMVLLTVADVVLRALFNYPLRGMLELIELGLACAVFLGLPAAFLRRGHLVVDVIDQLAPPSLVRLLDLVGAVVSFGVLAVMALTETGSVGERIAASASATASGTVGISQWMK